MKQLKLTIILSLTCFFAFAQGPSEEQTRSNDQPGSIRRIAYDRFVGKVLNLNSDAPQTSFLFDISKSPSLKLSLPIITSDLHQLFLDGDVSSTNDYTPIVKKGQWAPDASVNLSYTWFVLRMTNFYTREYNPQTIAAAPISDASQIFWLWITAKAGYNYSNYIFYNDTANAPLDKKTFEEDYDKSFLKLTGNFYCYPSKDHFKWLTIYGNVGYQYLSNDNNYGSLKSVNVKTTQIFTDTSGNNVEVILDETTAKKGIFKVSNASIIDYYTMVLFSPKKDFYFGLSIYGKTRITDSYNSTDLGLGITIPIQKMNGSGKTAASFTLKYDIPDVNNELSKLSLKEKGRLGFTIGVPITIL